jgi:ElaA protein
MSKKSKKAMNQDFQLYKFNDLSPVDLYEIIKLRVEIFVIEQNCIYQDLDDKDKSGFHLMGKDNGELICYVRLLPKGASYEKYVSIGRVVVKRKCRKKGIGYDLMFKAIDLCKNIWPGESIKISAQAHLQNFYNQCGFEAEGEIYEEDGIPHIGMVHKTV